MASQSSRTSLIVWTIALFGSYSEAKRLWSTKAATSLDIIKTAYPIGNGRLGGLIFGPAGSETITLNVDSLWSGGPFEVSNYTGGNPTEAVSASLEGIRDWIFTNGTGNVTQLMGDDRFYGSYRVLGNLTITIPGINSVTKSSVSNYVRTLDLTTGVHYTTFSVNGTDFQTTALCSFPDQACLYTVNSTGTLPSLEISLSNTLVDPALQKIVCKDDEISLNGITQKGPPEGMKYHSVVRLHNQTTASSTCRNSTLLLNPKSGTTAVSLVLTAGTNYDWSNGNRAGGYSFRGADPKDKVNSEVTMALSRPVEALMGRHVSDFSNLTERFKLSIPDSRNSSKIETAALISNYDANSTTGDPYLESLLFDYSNYLFISASRPGSLPPNLQGRWSEGLTASWSADYHANINLQMNHWTPDQTGLTDLQSPLWDYMEKTWVPRGTDTAKLLYNAPGWVVHNEMNVFGYTGMKSGEEKISSEIWADYPAAPAWMMQHVWDHWEYSQDLAWMKSQGYPLLKGVAQFWLSQLQEDNFTKDGSLVVNPCTSPEHGPTTFGCTHFQQLIHQVFDNALAAASIVSDEDMTFVSQISDSLRRLDKGIHIGEWGQIQEWKLPTSFGVENRSDTHRHLSELVGWFPGYSISSYHGGLSNATIQKAVEQVLISRGPGNAQDANAGWAKVWRAACWARLNNTERAHFEIRYAIEQNFVANGFSMYKGENIPFQIDANYGIGGAILSMLVIDLPLSYKSTATKVIVLGPAIPAAWGGGSVRGLRLRGGGTVDFTWDESGLVTQAQITGRTTQLKVLNKRGDMLSNLA